MNQKTGNYPPYGSAEKMKADTAATLETAATTTHEAIDRVADRAEAKVAGISGAAHDAVDNAADKATRAADHAIGASDQIEQTVLDLTDSATAAIRARPIAAVAGALLVGYLIGRLTP